MTMLLARDPLTLDKPHCLCFSTCGPRVLVACFPKQYVRLDRNFRFLKLQMFSGPNLRCSNLLCQLNFSPDKTAQEWPESCKWRMVKTLHFLPGTTITTFPSEFTAVITQRYGL